MKAHIIDATGVIQNTICVNSLGAGQIDASIGGGPGDKIVNGTVVRAAAPTKTAAEFNAPILAALAEIDAKSIRPLREGETERVAELAQQAAALRAQLRKD